MDKKWQCVLGGVLVHLVLGSLYCWGNITMAVTSYLRIYNSQLTYNDTIVVYMMQLGCQGLMMYHGGIIEKKIGSKYCVLLGGIILISGTLCASAVRSLTGLLFTYGAPFGIGMGITYSAPISVSIRWQPKSKGLVSGIIVAGFGFGAFVFGQIALYVVNPNGEDVDPSTGYFNPNSSVPKRVPLMFVVLASCYLCLYCIGIILINEPETPIASQDNAIVDTPLTRSMQQSQFTIIDEDDEHPNVPNFHEDNVINPLNAGGDVELTSNFTLESHFPKKMLYPVSAPTLNLSNSRMPLGVYEAVSVSTCNDCSGDEATTANPNPQIQHFSKSYTPAECLYLPIGS